MPPNCLSVRRIWGKLAAYIQPEEVDLSGTRFLQLVQGALMASVTALVLASPAFATTTLPLDLRALLDGAGVVFDGVHVRSETVRDSATGLPETHAHFAVRRVYHGALTADTYTLVQLGGRLDDGGPQLTAPQPQRFRAGARYLLFLHDKSQLGWQSPVGLVQGVMPVVEREGRAFVRSARSLAQLVPNLSALPLPSAVAQALTAARNAGALPALRDFEVLLQTLEMLP